MTQEIEDRMRRAAHELDAGDAKRASARLAERAEVEGVLDVAYARVDSPFGTLLAAATERGLVRLAYPNLPEDAVLEDLSRRVSARVLEHPARLDATRRELDDYFEGRRRDFDLDVDLSLVRGFGARVLEITARIPYGECSTYKEVAEEAGSPRGARAAGNALGANPIPIVVPCHRVLHSSGGLGGYTGGLDRKRQLLAIEGRPASG